MQVLYNYITTTYQYEDYVGFEKDMEIRKIESTRAMMMRVWRQSALKAVVSIRAILNWDGVCRLEQRGEQCGAVGLGYERERSCNREMQRMEKMEKNTLDTKDCLLDLGRNV